MLKEFSKITDIVPAQQNFLWDKCIDVIVETSDFPSREAIIDEMMRLFFKAHPELRLEMAIRLYQKDEVTLQRAAEIVELDSLSFQAELRRHGIVIEIGGATRAEIDAGLAFLRGEL